jgi:multidrug resistance efflux pump
MKHLFMWVGVHRLLVIITILLAAGGVGYYYTQSESTAAYSYAIVETVGTGTVSSGIHTTGEVVAAQKLDLDVYKQLSRIAVVNIANGAHVDADAVLVSFDKSDAYVAAQSTRVSLAEAELALNTEQENATDPNTEARTLQNKIATYKKSLVDTEQDIKDAYQDFLNEDLEVEVHEDDESRLLGDTLPTLSGRYVGTTEGFYTIDVYSSNSSSGYSYRVIGLESYTGSVVFGAPVDIGTRGLRITFPNTVGSGDTYVVRVPNIDIATYADTKRNYERTVADLKEQIAATQVNLANTEQELEDLLNTDTSSYRDLHVEKAAVTVQSTQQKLAENYDAISERDIVAPFAGTIQDMENVVVGATPTGGTEDTIRLGTLISDEFLTTFTLSATDVAKVRVGQKANVTITSFSEQPVFIAHITEISSLPSSDGVAQYEVRAKIEYDQASSSVQLREGVLADIEIVQEEKENTLRVPVSAITYVDGKPTVQVVDTITDAQKKEIEALGIIRTTSDTALPSYAKTITLGIYGTYYAEVTGGLEAGQYILTTATAATADTSVVEQANFGPGRRSQESEGGSAPAAPRD